MLKAAGLTLFTVALACATPALAKPAPQQLVVSYADLDLTQTADRAELNARVREAIDDVCGIDSGREFRDVLYCRYRTTKELIEASDGLVRVALENRRQQPTRVAATR